MLNPKPKEVYVQVTDPAAGLGVVVATGTDVRVTVGQAVYYTTHPDHPTPPRGWVIVPVGVAPALDTPELLGGLRREMAVRWWEKVPFYDHDDWVNVVYEFAVGRGRAHYLPFRDRMVAAAAAALVAAESEGAKP